MKICYKDEEVKFEVKRKKIYAKEAENKYSDISSFEDIDRFLKINDCEAEIYSINYIREVGADKILKYYGTVKSFYEALFFDYIMTSDAARKIEIENIISEFRFYFYDVVKYICYGDVKLTPDNYKNYLTKNA